MILHKFKIWLLTIIGAPLMLLTPIVKWSMRKLEEKIENDPESVPKEIRGSINFSKLDDRAYAELKSGNYEKASELATELLHMAKKFKDHWNYGNAIHHGNTILGLIAIKENNVEKAASYLRKSGRTPGSPQLNSFGPGTCLAIELLLKDQNSQVLAYLDDISKFWELGYKELPKWKEDISNGEIPESWERLKY